MAGRGSYRFLPPFFFPPLAVFFAICFYPPLRVGFAAKSIHRIAALLPFRHVSGAPAGAPRFFASLARVIAREVRISMAARMARVFAVPIGGQKNRGCKVALHTPRSGRPRLALLAALFLAALCGFLRHEFLLGTRLLSSLPATRCYNRWAERTTLIQHVDYGREHRTVKHKVVRMSKITSSNQNFGSN